MTRIAIIEDVSILESPTAMGRANNACEPAQAIESKYVARY
jgi:hypothetical protein